MATKKKDNKKPQGNLRRRARRDVRLAIDPVLDQIRRAQQGAENDYESAQNQVGQIYAGLQNQLQPLGGQYDDQAARIMTDLNANLGGLTSMLGSSVPTENAAATGLFGTMGAGAQTLLANDRSRNLGYQTSTQRQAGLDRQGLESRFLQEYRDLLDDLRQQRVDVMQDVPTQIMSRLDALRQQRTQNRLAQSELELRESIANKELNQKDRAYNDARRDQQNQTQFARSELERRQDRQAIKPIRKDIGQLKDRLGNINQNIDYYGSFGGPEAQVYAQELQKLYGKKRRVKKKIKRKRRRIQNIRND